MAMSMHALLYPKVNVKSWLNQNLLGNWEYDRETARWYCDDDRWVAKVHTGGYDECGNPLAGFSYQLYDADGRSRTIYPSRQKRRQTTNG